MTLSAIVVSLIALSTMSIITEAQNQEYSPSDESYYINMIENEIDDTDITEEEERERLEQNINQIGGYQVSTNYWSSQKCYNITLIRNDGELSFTCLKSSSAESNYSAKSFGGTLSSYIISQFSKWSQGEFNGTTPYKPNTEDTLSIGYRNGTSSDNLVGYWRLDRTVSGDGETIRDYSGNNYEGTAREFDGDEAGNTGVFSTNGLRFNGGQEYVEIGDISALKTFPLSVSAWINVENFPNNGAAAIVSSGAVSQDQGADLLAMEDGSIAFDAINSDEVGDPKQNVNGSVSEGVWIHAVGVWSGEDGDDMKLYLNGSLADTHNVDSWDVDSTTSPVRIGRFGHQDGGYFNGSIDEVKIYSRALSEAEVREMYINGANNPFRGEYNSPVISPSGSNDWRDLEVSASIPSDTSVSANFSALDSSNNLVEDQLISLNSGSNNYALSVPDSEKARISFNGTTSNVTKTWEIDETKVYYD